MFTEMMDHDLFSFSLTLSHELDLRFNKTPKIAASQKDVMEFLFQVFLLIETWYSLSSYWCKFCSSSSLHTTSICMAPRRNSKNIILMQFNRITGSTPCSLPNLPGSLCVYGIIHYLKKVMVSILICIIIYGELHFRNGMKMMLNFGLM